MYFYSAQTSVLQPLPLVNLPAALVTVSTIQFRPGSEPGLR